MKPILVTGASGKLGAYVVSHLVKEQRPVVAWSGSTRGELCGISLQPVPLEDPDAVRQAFREANPSAVIHCGAISAISDVYRDEDRALKVNRDATELLGQLAERIVYTSTDLVFDGQDAPYAPQDPASPLSRYGHSKLAGESSLAGRPGASVVRVSLMHGPCLRGPGGFFEQQRLSLEAGETSRLFEDEFRTPLAYDEAARGLVEIADLDHRGLLHFGGSERLSRLEMGTALARHLGFPEQLLEAISSSDINFPEPRPKDVSLNSAATYQLLNWTPSTYQEGLARLL